MTTEGVNFRLPPGGQFSAAVDTPHGAAPQPQPYCEIPFGWQLVAGADPPDFQLPPDQAQDRVIELRGLNEQCCLRPIRTNIVQRIRGRSP